MEVADPERFALELANLGSVRLTLHWQNAITGAGAPTRQDRAIWCSIDSGYVQPKKLNLPLFTTTAIQECRRMPAVDPKLVAALHDTCLPRLLRRAASRDPCPFA